MFGFSDGGFHPIDAIRSRIDNFRAHPFQNLAGMAAGAIIPGGGLMAGAGFDRYNQNQFDNSMGANLSRTGEGITNDTNASMNGQLNGPLGGFDGMDSGNQGGPGGGSVGMGGGMPQNYGSNQGWNQAQNWQTPSGFTGGSSFVQDIMSQLPGGENFSSGPMSHQDHLDAMSAKQNMGNGPGANYGVSNFMAGGAPVIFGSGDPNGKYHKYMQNMGG